MRDCRDCAHNTYRDIKNCGWVSCSHPLTTAHGPKWEKGDPAWVSMQTGDVPVSRIEELQNCPTWEAIKQPALAEQAEGGQ